MKLKKSCKNKNESKRIKKLVHYQKKQHKMSEKNSKKKKKKKKLTFGDRKLGV